MGTDEVDFTRSNGPNDESKSMRDEIRKVYSPLQDKQNGQLEPMRGECRCGMSQKRSSSQCMETESNQSHVALKKSRTESETEELLNQALSAQGNSNDCKVDGSNHTVVIAGPGCTINLNANAEQSSSIMNSLPGVDATDSVDGAFPTDEPDTGPSCSTAPPHSSTAPPYTRQTSTGPSMKKIFRFVSERIPLQWKNLARELPILPDDLIEAEIFQIEEMHRGNLKEQAYRSLIVWETSEPEQCTKEMLITALKDCRLNLVVKELSTQPWI